MTGIERDSPELKTSSQSPSELLCDWACIVFALWTLCCHLTVALGGTFQQLLQLSALIMSVGIVSLVKWRRWIIPPTLPVPTELPEQTRRPASFDLFQKGSVLIGLAGFAIAYRFGDFVTVWWWMAGTLTLTAVVIFFVSPFPTFHASPSDRIKENGLWLIAFACAVLALICHRPNADDAFYVNIAAASVDFPHLPIWSLDTLHGIPHLPIHLTAYRVHAYELWNGALAYLTGIPAIYCFQWISAALAAFFVPLAYAHVFRVLTPKYWLWAVATILFLFIAVGAPPRWYSNFAFVRIWQGKSIFLSVLLPLIYSYALRFTQEPTLPRWFLLAAAQVAAVGCSASALWAAPLAALITLGSMFHPTRMRIRVLLTGSLASVYILLLGWLIKGGLNSPNIQNIAAKRAVSLDGALAIMLGDPYLLLAGLVTLLIAWACCPRGIAQRFAISASLTAILMLLNPYTSKWIAASMTGFSYWRSFWGAPLPILMTFVLTAPLRWTQYSWQRMGGRFVYVALLAAFAVCVPKYSALSPRNHVRISFPELKTPPLEYQWAAKLNASVAPGSYVVAPPDINTWIPTFHHHAYPLRVRHYLNRLRAYLGPDNFRARTLMIQYVAGMKLTQNAARVFANGVERFNISGVCLQQSPKIEEARIILQAKGFRQRDRGDKYEIWTR